MAGAYALLYGGKAENYTKAAYLRATAARYRDLCQDKFKNGINDADWKIISNLLTASYEAIKVPN